MENETDVTRTQMDETRAALSEKLETLEQRVINTVQGASDAVGETVDNVTEAVQETVDQVKDAFDLPLQVSRHPWATVAGSIALGYLGGRLLFRGDPARPSTNGGGRPVTSERPRSTAEQPLPVAAPAAAEPDWLSGLQTQFGAEITKLKGLAIGTVLSVVRDLVLQSVAEPRKTELTELMDGITVKLGGEPVQGPVFAEGSRSEGAATEEEHENRDLAAGRGPPRASQRQNQTAVETVD